MTSSIKKKTLQFMKETDDDDDDTCMNESMNWKYYNTIGHINIYIHINIRSYIKIKIHVLFCLAPLEWT